MSLREAGRYCGGKSYEAVRAMGRRGRLPVIKKGGRLFVDRKALDASMKADTIPIPE
jgi:hypothetical protein